MIHISHTGRDRQRTEGKVRRVVLPVGWLPALAHSRDPQILIYHRNNDWFPTRMNGLWRLSHFLMRVWYLASSTAKRQPHPSLDRGGGATPGSGCGVDGGHNKLLSIVRHCCHCSTLKWATISRSFSRTRTDDWSLRARKATCPIFCFENLDDCEQNNNGYDRVINRPLGLCWRPF